LSVEIGGVMAVRATIPETGFEVVVIGAGVIGLAVAAALSKAGRSVLILEREPRIASGITSRNSEVVHAGLYYPTESLKAALCVAGRERLYAWCAEKRVNVRRLGKLIVATSEEEEATLDDLLARGLANGVVGLEQIDQREILRLEPFVSARRALHSRETGIVDGQGFCLSLLAAAESGGTSLALDRCVESLVQRPFGWQLEVTDSDGGRERIDAGLVVDAAGLDADRIALLAGLDVDQLGWRQFHCKGDYFSLAPGAKVSVGRLIYPVPEKAGLGIHATLDWTGRVRFGPDVEYVDVHEHEHVNFDVDPGKAARFSKSIERYLPTMTEASLTPDYAGIRPKLAGPGESFRDFVIEESSAHGAPGFIACIGIESPGLTAALAIAERVAQWASI
jgi:L-2-hydroxyglutarate oxidase LhgO